jgi:hypothetical protein
LVLDGPEPPGAPLRFSIRQICLITLGAAILVQAGMMHRKWLAGTPDPATGVVANYRFVSIWFAAGVCGVGMAVVGLLSYWAVLSPGRSWWRVLLTAAAVGLIGISLPWSSGREGDILPVLGWCATSALFVTGTLMVLRSAGFRWMKPVIQSRHDKVINSNTVDQALIMEAKP